MSENYDVIIIGGGIIGASIGYHLVKDTKFKVLLIDADHKGKATKASAGIISAATTFTEDDILYNFSVESTKYYPKIVQDLNSINNESCSYEESEEVVVALSDDHISSYEIVVERIFKRQEQNNYPEKDTLYELSIDEFKKRFPDLSIPKRALYFNKAGKIDGSKFAYALLSAAKSLGMEILSGKVTDLIINSNQVCEGVTLRHVSIKSKHIVIAGGAWSNDFEERLGFKLPLFPQRGQIAHIRINETKNHIPIIIALSDYYSLNWGHDHIVIGATREDNSGYEPKNTVIGVQEVLKNGMQMIPAVSEAEILDIRVGLRPYSQDKFPIIGSVPTVKGVWVATGHGPLGLTTAPITGKYVADALNGSINENLKSFSPARFA